MMIEQYHFLDFERLVKLNLWTVKAVNAKNTDFLKILFSFDYNFCLSRTCVVKQNYDPIKRPWEQNILRLVIMDVKKELNIANFILNFN